MPNAILHQTDRRLLVGLAILLTVEPVCADEPSSKAGAPGFELRAGDRVVLIGGGLIEQERRYGYLETRLSRRVPEGSLVFRNLGWAGDTVRGIARTSGYQNPDGFARLLKEVQDYKPTVLFIGYGTNESFDGPAGLAGFRDDYAKLLAKLAPLKARFVLLSAIYQEDLGRPFPDPAAHNRNVDKYNLAIHQLAEGHHLPYLELAQTLTVYQRAQPDKRLTSNGVELNARGSRVIAEVVENQLVVATRRWRLELDAAGKVIASEGAKIGKITTAKDGIRFDATDTMLSCGEGQFLRISGLPAADYSLNLDGKKLLQASAGDWQRGLVFADDRLAADADPLRQAIIANNELFYRRWRPFNDHSRHWGFIGGDGKLYDQEMAAQEKIIAERRRPPTHQYEIVRIGDAK